MHILLQSITSGKDNQTMKFCQLVEYIAWETFFLEIFCTKCGGETILRPFPKKSILTISLGQYSLKLYTVFFYCMLRWVLLKLLKLGCRSLTYT